MQDYDYRYTHVYLSYGYSMMLCINKQNQSLHGIICDKKSSKVLSQWFYHRTQTKLLFVENQPKLIVLDFYYDYDSPNLD
jgi:hypothetical protein